MRNNRIAVSVFYFCMGLCFSTWASRIPDIKDILGLGAAQLGSILFALPVGQFLALPFSGGFVTRFGSKRVLPVAIFLYACGLTFIGLASTPWHLVIALMFFGISGNLSNISVNTQGVTVEQLYARPIMAAFHGAWSIAGFTGALLGLGAIALKLSPYQHFSIVATLVVLVTLIFKKHLVLVPPNPHAPKRKKFFSRPEGILFQLGIIGFCSMATEGAMFDWSGVYFKEVIRVPAVLVPVGYASFMIMMASGRFVADRLIAKFGRQRVLFMNGLLISTGMFIAVAFPYLVPATIAFLIVGFGVSAVVPSVYSVAGRSSSTPGIALAAVTSVSYLGFLMGPPLIGWIASVSSLRVSYAVVGSFGFCISYIVSRFRELD
ncbi:MAG TPA: MFS transporter [Bdellovibrionota bacterium]|nr:MFS transporter [Bdellovibrionota bacterium]